MNFTRLGTIVYLLMLTASVTTALAQTSQVINALCGIIRGVKTIVGILAIALFLIGGIMYAIAHFLPSSVDMRKSMMSWSTAMITGGIIGLIIVIIASPLVQLVINTGNAAQGSSSLIGSITVAGCA